MAKKGRVRVTDDLVFVDNKVIGRIDKGVFVQRITPKSIYRALNAKGIDEDVLLWLEKTCHTWRLIWKYTKEIISIPMNRIREVSIKKDTGAYVQHLVKLHLFNQDQPPLQKNLL